MNSQWFKKFKGTPEEKRDLEDMIRNSVPLRMLNEILEERLNELVTNNSFEDYETGNWAYKAADQNGQIRALKMILKLTKLERTN